MPIPTDDECNPRPGVQLHINTLVLPTHPARDYSQWAIIAIKSTVHSRNEPRAGLFMERLSIFSSFTYDTIQIQNDKDRKR